MNLFNNDKAPAVLALLVAVVGFFVTSVIEEIRANPVVTYHLSHSQDGRVQLTLRNISRNSVVDQGVFQLNCATLRPCLRHIDPHPENPRYFMLERQAPVAPSNVRLRAGAIAARMDATLVPGAAITVTVALSDAARQAGTRVEFYYTAKRDDPQAILLLDARSLTARFATAYFDIMLGIFLLATLALTVMILGPPFWRAIDPKPMTEPSAGETDPNAPVVPPPS